MCFANGVAQIDAGQDREDICLHHRNQQFETVDRRNRRNRRNRLVISKIGNSPIRLVEKIF